MERDVLGTPRGAIIPLMAQLQPLWAHPASRGSSSQASDALALNPNPKNPNPITRTLTQNPESRTANSNP